MAQEKKLRPFTDEERKALSEFKEKHEQKLATDPEYKKTWEKQTRDLSNLFPIKRVQE